MKEILVTPKDVQWVAPNYEVHKKGYDLVLSKATVDSLPAKLQVSGGKKK